LVPCDASSSWWIGRVLTLAPEQRTAWVVAQCLDECKNEEVYAQACQKETFQQRMTDASLGSLLGADPPRKKMRTLVAGGSHSLRLLDENAQRSIAKSLTTHASGIRWWGAFCDAANITSHFPAEERDVLRFASTFASGSTFNVYVKHLRWAHRFLRLSSTWDSSVLAQVRRGAAKGGPPPRPWLALQADSVRRLVQIAKDRGDMEQAAILARQLGVCFFSVFSQSVCHCKCLGITQLSNSKMRSRW